VSVVDAPEGLAAVNALLAAGDVHAAMEQLRRLVEAGGDPEAELVLGQLLEAVGDYANSRPHMETAYRGFKRAEDRCGAARAGTALGTHYWYAGNEPAGRTWYGRVARLLEEIGPCVEQGYLELALIGCERRDVDDMERSARFALGLAREFDDVALECKAFADLGLALVTQGKIDAGMQQLDEALTLIASGEVKDPGICGKAMCASRRLVADCRAGRRPPAGGHAQQPPLRTLPPRVRDHAVRAGPLVGGGGDAARRCGHRTASLARAGGRERRPAGQPAAPAGPRG
jgi:tetratricopeptide (TPR) repeat protein